MKRSIIALSKRNSIIGEMISCYQKVLEDGGHTYYMIWIFEDQPDHVYTSEVENGSKFCGLYDDDKEAGCCRGRYCEARRRRRGACRRRAS